MAKLRCYPNDPMSSVGGVCLGISRFYDIDVAWVRLITILMALWGPGILAYIICWIAIPNAYFGN